MLKSLNFQPKKLPIFRVKEKIDWKIMIPVILFILLNTLKISLFNYFILPVQTSSAFIYKFEFTLLLAVIIYPLILRIRTRIVFFIIYAAQIAYIVANMSYYMFYHNYVHILQWITLIREALLAAGHSAAPMNWKIFIVAIDAPFFLYILWKYKKVVELNINIRFQRIAVSVISVLIIFAIETSNYNHGYSLAQYTSDRYRGETPIVERYGTLVNNFISLYNNFGDNALVGNLHYGKEQSGVLVNVPRPNFVVIQVESMDANVINQKYKDQYIAPYLHSLSENNVYYPYMMSYHMGGGTSDCEFSIINSVEPLSDYPAIKLSNYNYPNSLLNKLSEGNYKTLAFHGNVGDFYNRDVAFPKMGFQKFYDMNKMKLENEGWGASDGKVFDYTFNTLKDVKQPFISYDITMTSHGPFTNANNYYHNPDYDDIEDITVKDYFNSMSYVDKAIQDYVEKIQATYQNTYILIWGDHTPNISAKDYQQASYEYDGKYFEFVPLIMITPDHKKYIEDRAVASFADVSPTILKAAQIGYDLKTNGEDLLHPLPQTQHPFITYRGGLYDREELFRQFYLQDSNKN